MKNIISERERRIQEEIDREAESKHTHDWVSYFYVDKLKGTGQNMTSHCKVCGVNWYFFKNDPQRCPGKIEEPEPQKEELDFLPNLGSKYVPIEEEVSEEKPKKTTKPKKKKDDQ